MDPDSFVKLLIAILLVLLNGFFVAAEFSIVKVRYSQIQLKAAEGNALAKKAETIIRHLDAYLSATQLGITLASLALGWVGESALHHIFEGLFHSLNIAVADTTITTFSVVGSFLIITMMHIVFGELVPKSIAIRKSESTTFFIAYPLILFYNIFRPFIWLMNSISNSFLRMINIHPAGESEIHSTEELQLLVKQSADGGEIEEENYEIIKNAFDFTDHSAKQIMVPRQNIFSININDEKQDIVEKVLDSGYSRIPVYDGSIDNIIGIFYTKEFIREYVKNLDEWDTFDITTLLHEPTFVVGSKKISDLMKVFQTKKQHLAIVIDEFGGTEGIISLEDILEELVGEIQDEEDEEDKIVEKVGENTYWVQASQPLEEINECIPEQLPENPEQYNTLAGLIMTELNDIPEENQEFDINGYHFKILKMQNRGVELVEIVYTGKLDSEVENQEAHEH
ncbi:hemolysin family protein [Elizabethkingia sp. JS20170427COW]|uniref:hemolysin family protein n=1 Tax=Elizabethkingia sp. JS20170427COW TaxID=2583851 RepID=UPI0011106AA8|nr:hemolysin family protein [Elizabethkingia sp. JS20170427COW]QCX52690.1 HlyC/CorC family transporter [Elizabethkingia sp. JS20170427COW]